jgi:DNA repair exonuclease SbcCD ATPase subunit
MPVSLFVSGLGAYSGAVDLRIPDCALVAGPSESGKTSLLSALSLALTGSTPHGAE